MSFEAVSWALEAPVSGTQKVLLIGVASHADRYGDNAWPSIETLARYAYVDARSVQRAIGELVKAGFLYRDVNGGGSRQTASHMRPNLYRLNMAKTHAAHPMTPASPEPSIEPSLNHPLNTSARKRAAPIAKPDDVDEQTWNDWLQLRKDKKASVTVTVLKSAITEAAKANIPLERFLQIWCSRGSQGLEASWLTSNERRATSATSNTNRYAGAAAAIFEDATHV